MTARIWPPRGRPSSRSVTRALAESVDAAFPGSRVEITLRDGLFRTRVAPARDDAAAHRRRIVRRHIALPVVGGRTALAAARGAWTVLNEPESSLHPDLLPALAALIAQAGEAS